METGAAKEHYFSKNPGSRHRNALINCVLRNKNYIFLTDASTFSRAKIDTGTKVLAKCMKINRSDVVLDLGCGYGPIGIVAAVLAEDGKCYMVDINRRAARLAEKNVKLNNIKNAEVRSGNMFEPLDGLRFDVILTNPPINAGRKLVLAFIENSYGHLKREGRFYLVVRTKQGAKTIREIMKGIFGNAEYASIHSGYRVIMSSREE